MTDNERASLTRNQSFVYDELAGAGQPLTAYELLDRLREAGLKAPVQIYRALDALVSRGSVHRLESLNSFVACDHGACGDSGTVVFAICDTCDSVTEIASPKLIKDLIKTAHDIDFSPKRSTIEIHGDCFSCKTAG